MKLSGKIKIINLLFFFMLASSTGLEAGQLHVRYLTISDLLLRYGYVALGSVLSVDATRKIVRARIKRIWIKNEDGMVRPSNEEQKEGTERDFNIYTGVVWTDPRKSPVDMRIPGNMHLSEVKPGDDVIFAPNHGFEMIPANEETIKKLDLFFSENGIEDYKKNTDPAKLHQDLKDRDLQEIALEAMCERDLLDPSEFLSFEDRLLFDLGWNLRDKLSDERYDRWFSSLVHSELSSGKRTVLMDLSRETLLMDKISPVNRMTLLKMLDLEDEEQAKYINWYVRDEGRLCIEKTEEFSEERAETSVDFSLSLMKFQKFDGWDEKKSFHCLLALLPDDKKILKVKKAGELIMISAQSKKSDKGYDEELFDLFLELNRSYPSAEYLPEFGKIDISGISENSQSNVDNHSLLLDAAWLLAQKFPEKKKDIYNTFSRWAQNESLFTPNLIMSIDSESPDQKRIRWRSSLERFKTLSHE